MIKCLRQTHGTKFNSLFVQWAEKVREKNFLRNDKAQNHSIVKKLKSRTATTKKVHPLLHKYTGNRFTLKPKYALKNPATLFAKQMFFNWDFQMTYYASLQLKGLQNCGRSSLKVKKKIAARPY